MTQVATVEKLLCDGMVEVAVERPSACGHDCASCPGCGTRGQVIRITAADCIGVQAGDRVLLYSRSSRVLGAAAAVYLLPVAFFLLGYALSVRVGSILLKGLIILAALAVGILPAVLLDRKSRGSQRIKFEVRGKL